MAKVRDYILGGPEGNIALLDDGKAVLIPSFHCLSIGEEYIPELHSQEAHAKVIAEREADERKREEAKQPVVAPVPVEPQSAADDWPASQAIDGSLPSALVAEPDPEPAGGA